MVTDKQQLNIRIGAIGKKLRLRRAVHVTGYQRVICADRRQHDHTAVLPACTRLRVQAHRNAPRRERLLHIHAHNRRAVLRGKGENIAQGRFGRVRLCRDRKRPHRQPVHQAQHAVNMVIMRMREHKQIQTAVPLRKQLVRSDVARILHGGAAAAIDHHAAAPARKDDALPLTDVERRDC